MDKLFSFIIPVYNKERYLDRCLNSILCIENLDCVEIICIDDGSTDNSHKILGDYKRRYNCIKYYGQENQGVSATRNKGIKLATGQWIVFVDADDYINAQEFNKFLTTIENYISCNVIITGAKRISSDNKSLLCRLKLCMYNKSEFDKLLLNIESQTFDSPWAKLYEREFLIQNDLYFDNNIKVIEDAEFNYRMLNHSKLVATSPISFYNYDFNPQTSAYAKYRGKSFEHDFKCYFTTATHTLSQLDSPYENRDLLMKRLYRTGAFTIMYAIYSIYRSPNRPKHGLKALEDYNALAYSVLGGGYLAEFDSGIPKVYRLFASKHLYFGHLFLKFVFRLDKLRKFITKFLGDTKCLNF